jgi:predicted nucleotidyltransferase
MILLPRQRLLLQRILHEHCPDAKVWLFGSQARGQARSNSDIDLAIEEESAIGAGRLSRLRDALEFSDLSARVDVVDWHSVSPGFRELIRRDRVPLTLAATSESDSR